MDTVADSIVKNVSSRSYYTHRKSNMPFAEDAMVLKMLERSPLKKRLRNYQLLANQFHMMLLLSEFSNQLFMLLL